ncbi:uncharacterized protein [Procambarus clarkii]|uniref:uncharacterized protein isoform X2 n=1 Tax=Procambarus clarkii TaxID=6728 RepID=UPI003742E02C
MKAIRTDQCSTFNKLVLEVDSHIIFELRLYSGNDGNYIQIGKGSLDFMMQDFSNLAQMTSVNKVGDGKILRLSYDQAPQDTDKIITDDGTTLVVLGSSITKTTNIQYLILQDDITSSGLKVYREINGVTVNEGSSTAVVTVTRGTVNINDATKTKPEFKSVTLEHEPLTTTVEATTTASSDKFELVNYWMVNKAAGPVTVNVCEDLTSPASCNVVGYTPGSNTVNVLLVGYATADSNTMLESDVHTIQDYDIAGSFIFSQTTEWHWTLPSAATEYMATITEVTTKQDPTATFTTSMVTCDTLETFCYGYFLGLGATNQYTVMIQPKTDTGYDALNQIVSGKVSSQRRILTNNTVLGDVTEVIVKEIVFGTDGTFDICYKDPLAEVTYAEITVVRINGDSAEESSVAATAVGSCTTFSTPAFGVNDHIVFELRLYSGQTGSYTQISKGSLDFTVPDLSNLAQLTSVNKVGDGKILRLSYDQAPQDTDKIITDDGTTLVVLGSSITKTNNIQYLILQDDITSSGLKVYREINGVTVNEGSSTAVVTVTRGTVNINDATKTKPEFKSVTLEHEPLTTTVEATTTASSDKFELVNYWTEDEAAGTVTVTVCEDLTSPASCNVVGYTPGSNTVNVLLVGYATADSNTMLESDVHTIQDYDIAGSFIFSQTTEWHWTLPSAATEYMATITEVTTKQDPTVTFTTSMVTCDTLETFCYGYFLGLGATNQYTVMIQPKTDTGYDALNQIVSGKVSSQRRILTNNTVLGDVTEVIVKEIVFGTDGTFDICYKDPLAEVTYAEITVVRINGDSAEESSVAATAVGSCTTFSTPAIGVNDHIVFELRLYSGQTGSYTQISKGSLDFTMPDLSNLAQLTSVNKVGDGKILRLSYNQAPQDTDKIITDDGTTLVVLGSSITKTTNIQYLILQDGITSSGLKVYREINGVTVNEGSSTAVVTVTRGTVTINDATKTKPEFKSVTLEHEPLTTTVEATPTASSDKFELVNYWTEDEAAGTVTVTVCEDLTSPASCNVVGYTPGSNTVNVLLVGYATADSNTMLESDVHTIQDYDIAGSFIFSQTTEWHWTLPSAATEYMATITEVTTNQDPTATFTTSMVTCNTPETFCYGYFLGLGATNQYTVMIQPKTDTGYDALNQIVSGKVSSQRRILTNNTVLGDVTEVIVKEIIFGKGDTFDICYKDPLAGVTYAEITVVRINGDSAEESSVAATAVGSCTTFSTPAFGVNDHIVFELRLYSGQTGSYTQISKGSLDFTMPDLSNLALLTSVNKVGDGKILRLSYDQAPQDTDKIITDDGTTLVVLGSSITKTTNIQYLILQDGITSSGLKVYREINGVTVNEGSSTAVVTVTRGTVTINDATKTKPEFKSVTLEHEPLTTTVEATPTASSDKFELVNYWTEDEAAGTVTVNVCEDLTSPALCNVVGYTPGSNTVNVLLVGYATADSNTMLESDVHTIQDYDIAGSFIFSQTTEWHWTLPSAATEYMATITEVTTNQDPTATFTTSMVTCNTPETFCYGYFLGLGATNQYTVMIQPKTDTGYDALNQIVSGKVSSQRRILTNNTVLGDVTEVIVKEIVFGTGDTFDICYEEPPTRVTYAEITVVRINGDSAEESSVAATAVGSCTTFSTPAFGVNDHVVFELRLYSGQTGSYTQISKGSLDFTVPDLSTLPECSSGYKVGDGKMLRLSCDKKIPTSNDKISTDDGTTLVVLGTSDFLTNKQYLLLKDKITSQGLNVYREIKEVTVNDGALQKVVTVRRGTADIKDATQKKPEFTSVTLEHEPLTTTVEATPTASSDKFELVNYWTEDEAAGTVTVNVCEDLTSPALCNVVGYTPGSNTVNVLLVGYATADSNTMLESDVHTIQDYDIAGSFIFSQTTEWHWTLPSAATEYMATITEVTTKQDPTATFTTSTVTCNTPETFCYGYFLGLGATNQYTVMIQPKSGTGYNDLNKIVSGKVSSQRRILTNNTVLGDVTEVMVKEIVFGTGGTFDICYKDPLAGVTYAEITVVRINGDSAEESSVAATAVGSCTTFSTPAFGVNDHVVFELRLYSGQTGSYTQISKGSLDFTMPDFSNFALLTSVNKVGDGKILRLSYDEAPQDTDKIITDDGMTLVVVGSSVTKTTNIQYLILQDDITSSGLKVYREIEGVTVNDGPSTTVVTVTRGTVTINDATKIKPDLTSVTLEHEPLTTTVEATTTASSDKFELVNYWLEDEAAGTVTVNVCEDLTSPASCNVVGYTPGSNTVNVLLVGYAAAHLNTMLESDVHIIQDYDITGRFISSTITEWYWTMKSEDPEYNMIIQLDATNQDPPPTFTTSTVTCDATDTSCYGYFLGLGETNQYTVKIQPKTGTGYDALNQIVSGKVSPSRTIVTNDSVLVEQQKGNATRISWRKPEDYAFTIRKDSVFPVVTSFTSDNLTSKALGMDFGARLPRETQDSAVIVNGMIPMDIVSNDVPELTIKYITFSINLSPAGKEEKVLVELETAQDVTAATSLTLAFISSTDGTHQYSDTIDAKLMTKYTSVVAFDNMKDYAFSPGEVRVVVTGHNNAPVAYGLAQIILRDPKAIAYRVGKVGDSAHEAFRITYSPSAGDSGGVQLDYDNFCECHSSPCYCLGRERVAQEPRPFCLQLNNAAAATTEEFVLQCDDKLTATNADEEAQVTSVKMTHKKDTNTADVQVDVTYENTVELTIYESGTTSVNTPTGTCTLPSPGWCILSNQDISSDITNFNILLVTADKNDIVQKSNLLSFEDYKTKVTQLTSDAIEVRFSAKTKTLYQVTVTPDGGAYDTTTIECGAEDNNLCTVYFIAMTAGNNYEATVQLRTSGELNQVATQFVMETREKISRNATLAFRAKGSERLLDLCVGDQLPSTSGDYILVLIAGLNNTVITKGPLSNENPCFYDVSVDVQPSQHVNIMVLTDEENTRVVMETDVFILDQTSADISVTQVGSKALKATWSNRNLHDLEYEVGLDGVGHTVACKAQQECIEYIHLNSSEGNTTVTIKENNDGTVQVVSVEVSPVTITELTIASRSIQWDDRLRVCFDRLPTADAYELGLEKDDTHLQTNVHAQVDTHATSETCIVSADTVDVGAYVDLWMVVTAFEASGTIVASGESTWNTILLSSSRNVRAAIQNTTILASWYLLDDTSTIDNFQVILRSSDGDTAMLASNTQSAYTFTSQSYGTYTVCVKALKVVTTESTVDSEEVCSDIIVFSNNAGPTQNVHETEPKSTAKDSVLLTWQPPQGEENVSGYYVSWSNVNPSSKRSPRHRLPPQSLMRSHEELQQWVSGEGDADFVIVPATETSVEVKDLQEDAKYTFCVSSIVNDVMAQSPACSNTSLADFIPLSPPSLLNPSGGELQWTDNNTGDITYMVEWRSPSEDDHLEVSETSYHLQVAPGKWDVSVRALSADSCSDPNTTTVTIPGVPTSILQVGSKKMTVTWYEEPTPQDNNRYIVDIFQDTQPVDQCTLGCSGDASKGDCSCEFSLETIQPPVVLTVSVHMYSQESYDLNFTMMQISGMRPVATTIRSSSEVDVKWEAVENAKFYQLSLYENESLSVVRWAKQQALPLWVTLTEEDMMGNVFVVQACTDESHCGDATQMTILDQNTSGGSSVVGAVLGGVLGVTILACVIFFFVKRQQVKKKERKALNDQEMAPAEYIYDEWGARRLGQAPVATTLSNTS